MNNLFGYSIGLLVILMAVSFIMASAQEDDRTTINNTLTNLGSNLSVMNDTIPDAAIAGKIDPMKKVVVISSDKVADPASSIGSGISGNFSRITPFIICGFTRPTKETNYENQSLLNAACLSRIVEGTPHGYVTYHN